MFAPLHIGPLAYFFILLVVAISVFAFYDRSIFGAWRLHPYSVFRCRRLHTLFTSLFVHVDVRHLLVNVGILCFVLPEVEYMLVKDLGPLTGRLLLLACIAFVAVFSGALSAIGYRNRPGHYSTGASALIWALVLVYLMYFPVEPLINSSTVHPPLLPFWLALLIVLVMLLQLFMRAAASAIHLYGALAGILFALAVRPQAIQEIAHAVCPAVGSKERNDESAGEDHASQQPVQCTVDESALAPFAALDSLGLLILQPVHPFGDLQC